MSDQPDALDLVRMMREAQVDYRPITLEEAVRFTNRILAPDDDDGVVVWVFIRLMEGLAASHLAERRGQHDLPTFEGLVSSAMNTAYARTTHYAAALNHFALLDPQNPRDWRVLVGQFVETSTGE